jgi:hypothetical protein
MPFIVVVDVEPLTFEPTVMLVVDPDTPPVPMLTVFVSPVVVAPVARLVVLVVVAEPNVLVGAEKMLFAVHVFPLLTAGIVPVAIGIV